MAKWCVRLSWTFLVPPLGGFWTMRTEPCSSMRWRTPSPRSTHRSAIGLFPDDVLDEEVELAGGEGVRSDHGGHVAGRGNLEHGGGGAGLNTRGNRSGGGSASIHGRGIDIVGRVALEGQGARAAGRGRGHLVYEPILPDDRVGRDRHAKGVGAYGAIRSNLLVVDDSRHA